MISPTSNNAPIVFDPESSVSVSEASLKRSLTLGSAAAAANSSFHKTLDESRNDEQHHKDDHGDHDDHDDDSATAIVHLLSSDQSDDDDDNSGKYGEPVPHLGELDEVYWMSKTVVTSTQSMLLHVGDDDQHGSIDSLRGSISQQQLPPLEIVFLGDLDECVLIE